MIKNFAKLKEEQKNSSLCRFSHMDPANVPYDKFLSWMQASQHNLNQVQVISYYFKAAEKVEPNSPADKRLTRSLSSYFYAVKEKENCLFENKDEVSSKAPAKKVKADYLQRDLKMDSFSTVVEMCLLRAKEQKDSGTKFDNYIKTVSNNFMNSVVLA